MPTSGSPANHARRSTIPVLLVISTAYIAVLLNIQGFVAMLPLVQSEFGITRAQAGLYSSFYFLSATLIAVLAGRLVDRLGPRVGMLIGCGTMGAMMIAHGIAPGFGMILGLAFATGVGFSLITPSVNGAVIANVPADGRAGSMGIAHGVGGLGALAGTMLLPALGERYGWRPVILVAGVAAILIGVFIALSYGRFATGYGPTQETSPEEERPPIKRALKDLLSHRAFVCACVMGISFGFSIGSVTGHFALFLHQDLGYTPTLAGIGLGAFHVGGIIGQPSWGVINDRLYRGRRHAGLLTLALLTGALSLVYGLAMARGVIPFTGIVALSFLMGFCVLGTPSLFFTTVTEIAPASAGTATGIALIFSRVGIVVAPPLFGLIADARGEYSLSWLVLAVAVVVVSVAAMVALRVPARRTDQAV